MLEEELKCHALESPSKMIRYYQRPWKASRCKNSELRNKSVKSAHCWENAALEDLLVRHLRNEARAS